MDGKENSSKPSPGRKKEVKPMMGTRDMIRKQFEEKEMSLGSGGGGAAVAETSRGDYHAKNSIISRLIADRRKVFEAKKLIRRAEWKESMKGEEVEDRANFECVMQMQLPDLASLAWENVFEYISDPNERRMLRNMTKQWRELMLNERTTLLFSSVLPVLFKTEFLKIEEAFNCRLVCKEWKISFDQCLQDASRIDIDCKQDVSWAELTNYAPRSPISLEEEAAFRQMFSLRQIPSVVSPSRSLKFYPNRGHPNQNQREVIAVFGSLRQMVEGVDSLFLDFSKNPSLTVILDDDWFHNFKHLGINELPLYSRTYINNDLSPGLQLETLALYNVHRSISDDFLRDHRQTLKTIIQKGKRIDESITFSNDALLPIQRLGPFPNLRKLIFEFGPERPEFTRECQNCVPSLEELQWKCTHADFRGVMISLRCVNFIGRNLRHLRLVFMNPTSVRLIRYQEIDGCNLRLNLPKLETFELTLQRTGVKNIDFILPCESLKEFYLTVFKKLERDFSSRIVSYSVKGGKGKKKALTKNPSYGGLFGFDEIINYNGYEDSMYESNIWELFPDLRKLRISVIIITATVYREGSRDEEEKWSKFYTRDGFKKYQEKKNEN